MWSRGNGGSNIFGIFERIISGDLMAEPDERLADFAVIDIRAGKHGEKQHDPDGAAKCEAIHPAWRIRICFPFKRREWLEGRRHAPGSNWRSGKRLRDSRLHRSWGHWFRQRKWNFCRRLLN
jgi:hypothetical protein